MKLYFNIILGTILFSGCHQSNIGRSKLDKFVKEYRAIFSKSDLTLYDFNPRTGFEYNSDSLAYRVLIGPNNRIRFSVWEEPSLIDTNSAMKKFLLDYNKFAKDYISEITKEPPYGFGWLSVNEKGKLILLNDSDKTFLIPDDIFTYNPVIYFSELKKLIDQFGILEIQKSANYIIIIFDSDSSLIYYFDDSYSTKDYLNKKSTKFDKNWYLLKDEHNADHT